MNILYIHTHDSGRFIQPYGHAVPTPNLMQLAREGVLFRQCYSCAPTCSPSRAGLLTGSSPHAAGMLGLAHRGFELSDRTRHLAHYLGTNGYHTALCGMQHVIEHGREKELGYAQILTGDSPDPALSGIYRDMAVDEANAQAAAKFLAHTPEKPFFLSFGMTSTHFPLPDPADDINPNFVQVPPSLPDTPEIRKDMAGYLTLARHADKCVGIVLKALAANGLDDQTLVFFTTDHGIAFPQMKCNLYDHGIGVSLIMRFPKGQFAGQVVDGLVSHLDLYPTLCELAGITAPRWLEGHSLMPLIRGETDAIRNEIFGEVTYHAAYEPLRAIRTARYKYIRYFDNFEAVVLPNIDNSRSKRFLLAQGLAERKHNPAEMLFDLYFDPHERNNLAADPDFAEIKADLAGRLAAWMSETNDPLLDGPVPLPPGGYTDPRNGLHPN